MSSRSDKPSCRHCGAPLSDQRERDSGFCCAGCAYVYRLVHESGLSGYYQLKDGITAPADPAVFQPRDYEWLGLLQHDAEAAIVATDLNQKQIPSATLTIQGISCAGCVWLIERLYLQQPGARDIMVNAQTGEMRLRWVLGAADLVSFAQKLQSFGYLAGPPGSEETVLESRSLAKRIGLCAAFAMNVMLFTLPTYFGMERSFAYARLFDTISLTFATLSLLVGGTYFLNRAVRALREGSLHIDLPIGLGIAGAYLGSLYGWLSHAEVFIYFDFVSTFILLMLVGRWAQVVAVERNQRRILRQQLKPPHVKIRTSEGILASLAPEKLTVGQSFLLAPGQSLPVEAVLEVEERSFSLASINGESEPRVFRAGELVPAGALNISLASATLVARQEWRDSLIAKLLGNGERLGWRHRSLERIIQGYLIGIFAIATLSGLFWWFHSGDALRTGSVVTAVLVVSCPCAIGLAFPLADEMAAIALRRKGVFVRENDLWSKLKRVRRILFDKTGTLTLETPELINPEALLSLDDRALSVLHSLVRNNAHPVSQTLLAELLAKRSIAALPGDTHEKVGAGVEMMTVDGDRWALGRPGWALLSPRSDISEITAGAEVCFSRNGKSLASFHFADRVRSDARLEISKLVEQGFGIFILSGDHPEKVSAMAKELDLPSENAIGGLSPLEKAAWLESNQSQDTLMLGDGANDSLAFDHALCRGTPVIHRGILEHKADFFYLGRGIAGIRSLFATDLIRRRAQTMILAFSVVYNAFAVGLAATGHMNPLIAAVLMPLNSLLSLLIVTSMMKRAFR